LIIACKCVELVLVAIDEKTLDKLGRWPVGRNVVADAITRMQGAGASVIAFDVLFSEPDKNSILLAMAQLREVLQNSGLETSLSRQGLREAAALAAAEAERLSRRLTEAERRRGGGLAAAQQRLSALRSRIETLREQAQRWTRGTQALYDEVLALQAQADTDRYLAQRIKAADNVILGYFFHGATETAGTLDPAARDQRRAQIEPSRLSIVRLPAGYDYDWLPGKRVADVEVNIPQLSAATNHFGFFTIFPDDDGTVRQYPTIIPFDGEYYPSLALKAVALHREERAMAKVGLFDGIPQVEELRLGRQNIPVDEAGQLLINYRGGQGSFPTVSFADVVAGDFDPALFEDRIALVGATAIGIMDLRVTPFSQSLPGPEIHANVIDNILRGDFYQKPDWMWVFDLIAVVAIGFFLGVVLAPLRSVYSSVVVLLVLFVYLVGGQWLLSARGIWLTTIYPLMEISFVYLGILLYKYYAEERQRKEIRSAFQYYLAPAVIEQVLADPDKLRLGGEKKTLSVLFSDVRGFTTISEALDAQELSALLNEYLTPMTQIVFERGGTLDKYMGDAIMAFYGAPIDQPDHPERACRSALEMMQAVNEMRQRFEARGLPPIDIGIGINTGPMSVGNMGSAQRFDYTVMGDAVNLGSRLEAINKQYGTHIIAGPQTYAACRELFFFRELDLVAVKGKKEPVAIYELIAFEPVSTLIPMVREFERALLVYRQGDFHRAFELFQSLAQRYPDDGPARVFAARARELLSSPPPDGTWDGVFVAKSK